jgi:hypothetical protein
MDARKFIENSMAEYPQLRQIKAMKIMSHVAAMMRRYVAQDREEREEGEGRGAVHKVSAL